MKIILQDKNQFVLRFDKDEEVLEGLQKFMKEQAVSACVFFGIGACSSVELGFYNAHLKDYRKKPYIDEMEIISFIGSGALLGDNVVLHAHGSFGDNTFSVVGGHVFKLTASVTCEIFLTKLDGALERIQNPDFNLNLLA
jgi:predicted DNA-binding protein with PD1-like motif